MVLFTWSLLMNGIDPWPPAILIPSAVPGLRMTRTRTLEHGGMSLELTSETSHRPEPSSCQQYTTQDS